MTRKKEDRGQRIEDSGNEKKSKMKNLFRIWDLEFRICNVCYSSLLWLFTIYHLP